MKCIGIIPVRMESERLPGKPLADVSGMTLVERVWRQAVQSELLAKVVIATDSEEIANVVGGFGADVVMTPKEIENGSQRVAVAVRQIASDENWDVVVNIQGDMPFIQPKIIDDALKYFIESAWDCSMATIASPIFSEDDFRANSVVKVVLGESARALYFTRAAAPHSRDGQHLQWQGKDIFGYKHFGLYLYKPEVLSEFTDSGPGELERVERLEQLRILEKNHKIAVHIIDPEFTIDSVEVDTVADLERAKHIAARQDEKSD